MIRYRRATVTRLLSLWLISALAACAPLVPGRAPPHIKNTPGAYVVVTDKTFIANDFRLDFPRSWSVVKTSQAYYPHIHALFLAPDGGRVSLQGVDAAVPNGAEYRSLPNGVILKLSIEVADEPSDRFMAQARQLISSIRVTS